MAAAAGAALLIPLTPLAAQQVTGRVLDDDTNAPLAGALVELLDEDREPHDRTLTDAQGEFSLEAPEPGPYRLHIVAIRYVPLTTEPLAMIDGEVLEFTVRLHGERIPRDAVVLESRAALAPESSWRTALAERMRVGRGTFIVREQLAERAGARLDEVLRTTPGVRIDYTAQGAPRLQLGARSGLTRGAAARGASGRVAAAAGLQCTPALVINGAAHVSGRLPPTGTELIGFLALNTDDLEVVEIYRNRSEVPSEYSGIDPTCGLIAVWTRRSDP
jgi:hypothetical protein